MTDQQKPMKTAVDLVVAATWPGPGKPPPEVYAAAEDFVADRMSQDGIMRQVMPPVLVSDEKLDQQVTTDKPVKVIDENKGPK